MKSLHKKVAVVTGAGSGIGRAIGIELAQHGCVLALSDINETALQTTKQLILDTAPNTTVHLQVLDVANKQAVFEYADKVNTDLGCVDLIINNAGVALSSGVDETKREDFEWLMNINFWGVVNGTGCH
jgi:NADP-dependent 3-hydroxy acid dehydrogenase YdfG